MSPVPMKSMCRSFSLSVASTTVAACGVLKVSRIARADKAPIGRLMKKHLKLSGRLRIASSGR
jgi:hypothetical protein